MNEENDFALMPRPPGALEKAEPGAKRVLSGMVADALALVRSEKAKPVFTLLAGDDDFAPVWEIFLNHKWGGPV